MTPQLISIGFVGKRKLPTGEATLRATLAQVLAQLAQEFPGPAHALVGLTSLAMGADTVFAELFTRQEAPPTSVTQPVHALCIFLPTPAANFFMPADFRLTNAESAATVRARLARSTACLTAPAVQEIRVASTHPDRDERFAETADAIVHACSLLIVACTQADKTAALGAAPSSIPLARGGSAETLQYAHALGKRIIMIEVDGPVGPNGLLPITNLPGAGC